ncbi:DUF3800 domain-containing protein [Pseudomonas viridiflava]|uniref:DUF3800 domain-containing protein n=1 Tax=Pseudomonas viridiflava TaxID=33069 RepID=UPI000F018744|nr:DUF3800 domain-containing protein [Pseudomonas viridiflava]
MIDDSSEKIVIDAGLFRFPGQDLMKNINKAYTLYYDETNNIRRLSLTGTGLNHEVLDCFVLGGVALGPGASLPDINALRAQLRIQPSVKELKLKHLAQGDYITCLNSNKLEQFLTWLLESPAYIHFSNFSILNWSIVDLIDSLLDHDQFETYTSIRDDLKNELHAIVRLEPLGYFRLLKTFDYPNVPSARIPEFLKAVRQFLFSGGFTFRNMARMALSDLLQEASRVTTLVYLCGNEKDELVGGFDTAFIHRLATFVRSVHVFDEEPRVRESLERNEITWGGQPVSYRFAISHNEPAIQISDILCGLLGKHFSFMEKCSIYHLEEASAKLSVQHRRNADLVAKLIDKADEECPAFVFNQAPHESNAKSLWFLHGIEYPEDYRDL